MDQDFYIEESSPFKIIFTLILVISLIVGGIYLYFNYSKKSVIKLKKVTVELGEVLPTDNGFYLEGDNISNYTINLSKVSVDSENKVNSVGEYSYKATFNDETYKGKIYVKDTTKPIVEVQDLDVGVDEEFEPSEFVTKCEDLSLPCSIKYKKSSDEKLNKNEGSYNVTLIIKDNEGNEVEKNVKLNVSKDKTLLGKKTGDLTYHHSSLIEDNWDKTYTLKLDKAVEEDSIEYEQFISEVSNKEYVFDKNVVNKEIIVLYNQYDYAIGFSLKVTFDDESTLFVTEENSIEKNEDELVYGEDTEE